MFEDRRSIKIRAVLKPLLYWFISGCIAELIGTIVFYFVIGGKDAGYAFGRDFFLLLSGAHERFEILMVLFRNLAPLVFFIRWFKGDSTRIGDRKKTSEPKALWLLSGVGFCLFMNLLLFMILPGNVLAGGGLNADTGSPMFMALLFTELIAAPLTEEYMCRGLIYRRVRTYKDVLFSSMVSAFVFAVLHWDITASLYAFFLSFLLCDVYEMTRSVLWCAAVHAAANLTAVLILYVPAVTEKIGKWPVLFCIFGAVLLIGARILISLKSGKNSEFKGD